MRSGGWRVVVRPALDTWYGLDRVLAGGYRALGLVFLGLLVGWWIYVPLHELLHAFACLATGGTVTRLEVSPIYGGALLAAIFPWVEAGGPYAGRLADFDTGGCDLVYLATDLGPFLMTLFPGVYALRRAVAAAVPWLYGLALPFALAPFLSLTGDYYEIGSILVTQLPPWPDEALRSDDLLAWIEHHMGVAGAPWGGAVLAAGIGLVGAVMTYALGAAVARRLGAGPVSPPSAPSTTALGERDD